MCYAYTLACLCANTIGTRDVCIGVASTCKKYVPIRLSVVKCVALICIVVVLLLYYYWVARPLSFIFLLSSSIEFLLTFLYDTLTCI